MAQSKITGGRGSMMEDVMANMSKPSSSTCAGVIAGQGETLSKVGLFDSLLPVLLRFRLCFVHDWKHHASEDVAFAA